MHDHNHHTHTSSSVRILIIAIVLTLLFAVIEAIGGWWANSLALLSDAGHMASDSVSLIIAAIATWLAQKPPSKKHSYGLGRAEVIAAWISSMLMLIISVAVIVEAISRIHEPEHVKGGAVMLIAFSGLIVNLVVAWMLSKGEQTLNMRAALLHVLGDILGSFVALVSGAVIYYTGWLPIDPILSILIGILILISSLRLLRESMQVLMEGVPKHININQVANSMQKISGVEDIHDLHIWTLSSGRIALSAHVNIHDLSIWHTVLTDLKQLLLAHYSIEHITLQPEPEIVECKPCKAH